jgi:SAM-dependent methyltransferase
MEKRQLPPSETLVKALSLFEAENVKVKRAIDLGCGTGLDTIELLSKGWFVTAIDKNEAILNKLAAEVGNKYPEHLVLIGSSFENVQLPVANLINASFALPFCRPEKFSLVWDHIKESLPKGGRFAGHFFGLRDSWAGNEGISCFKKEEINSFFDGFKMEAFEEIEKTGKTITGTGKNWHVFHLVAKKL